MDYRGYKIRADFLPNSGLVYVDTSGIIWLPGHKNSRDMGRVAAELNKLAEFNYEFRKRKFVLTTRLVLGEIRKGIIYYTSWEFNKINAKRKRNGSGISNNLSRELHISRKGKREYNKMYEILRCGQIRYKPRRKNNFRKELTDFLEGWTALSPADKELVRAATISGNGNGILSADSKMMDAYNMATKEFRLKNCFICNSTNYKVISLG